MAITKAGPTWHWVTDGWPCFALADTPYRVVMHGDDRWHLYRRCRGTARHIMAGRQLAKVQARAEAMAYGWAS